MPDISVIIPTCNRPQYLNRTLASLMFQQTKASYEILVLDDYGKDDRARGIVRFWNKKRPIRYLNPAEFGMKRGRTRIRNLGIRQAQAPILVFLDDDMIASPHFIEEHFRAHENADKNVVLGYRYYVKLSYQFLEYVNPVNIIGNPGILENLPTVRDEREAIYRTCHGDPDRLPAPWVLLYSNNCSVRKTLLEEAGGGFDEMFMGAWGGEDVELGYRLHKAGARYVLNRRALGYHQWHYVDWRKNIASLKINLLKFFHTHPSLDTELYVDYVETGLDQYLSDLTRYSDAAFAYPRSIWDGKTRRAALAARIAVGVGKDLLVIGAGSNTFVSDLQPAACCDVRDEIFQKGRRRGDGTEWHRLLGLHLPYDAGRFPTVFVNDFVTLLAPYHRKLLFKEAFRLTSDRVVFATQLRDLRAMLSAGRGQSTTALMEGAVGGVFGMSGWTNARIKAEIIGDMALFTIVKQDRAMVKRLCEKDRIIVIADSGMADAYCDNAIELTLALAKRGCQVALQFEDYKTLELVRLPELPFWERYSANERKLLLDAMSRDLRGEKHLYAQLSLTGQSHYFDCRIEWLRSKNIGVLSSPYVHALNDQVDSVWCPSQAVKDSFTRSGGKSEKALVLPVGVAPQAAGRRIRAKSTTRFRFLCIGTVEKADGIDVVLKAFCRAFRKFDKVELIVRILPLKNRSAVGKAGHHNRTVQYEHTKHVEQAHALYRFRLEKWRAIVRQHRMGAGRVKFERIEEELRAWPRHFDSANCYVQAHRMDPIGQRVLQAMSLGLPVVTTGRYLPAHLTAGGMNHLVRSREVTAADGEWSNEVIYSRWAEPSLEHVVKTMKHVYASRRDGERRAAAGRRHALESASWDVVAERVMKDLERLSGSTAAAASTSPMAELFLNLKQNGLINIEEEAYERR